MRSRIANEKSIPSYTIFPDRTLLEIVKKRPETKHSLRNIHGIGANKYQAYADEIMHVLSEHGALA
jgi:ATP-dependent DNA helicase RecQ